MSDRKTSREKLSADWLVYLLIIMMLALQGVSAAETPEADLPGNSVPNWSADLKLKNYFNSHTSGDTDNGFAPFDECPLWYRHVLG